MATKTASRNQPEVTEARILGAAKDLFLEHNYADVTTDMIISSAGVTKGGMYHHFTSKSALYTKMIVDDLEHKRELFGQAVRSSGTCRERLERLTRQFLELADPDRRLTRLVRRDINAFSDEERGVLVRAYQRAVPEQLETIIRDGMRDGEVTPGDPRILSWSFVALVETILGDYADTVFDSNQARLDHVLNLFFDGVAAKSNGGTS
jgi:AcrR family transcriptional regulator